jgi:hypothetical protein
VEKANRGAVDAVPVAGVPWVHRAGAEGFWSLCAPSAAKLDRIAAVVMTVIRALAVIAAAATIRQSGTGE